MEMLLTKDEICVCICMQNRIEYLIFIRKVLEKNMVFMEHS